MISEILSRIYGLFGMGTIRSKTGAMEFKLDLLSGEAKNKIRLIQQRGIASIPKSGDKALSVFPNGDRKEGFIISIDDSSSIKEKLSSGDVALYTAQDNMIHLEDANKQINIKTDLIVINGVDLMETLKDITTKFNSHNHGGNGANPPATPIIIKEKL